MKNSVALDANHFKRLRGALAAYGEARREVIKRSSDVLTRAKQAIFAFHRDDVREGERLLEEADRILADLARRFRKVAGLEFEGSYRAALEEYTEARLVESFLRGKKIGAVQAPGIDEDAYLGGLLDFTGELVRRAVTVATRGDYEEVDRCHRMMTAVMTEIIPMNITGPLRPKFDQAKTNLRKMEDIAYDIAIRSRGRVEKKGGAIA